jgi:outer membrane receptor protein involved in Fe transport
VEFDLDNRIRDLSLKQTLTFTGLSSHTFTAGMQYHNLAYDLDVATNVVDYDPSITVPTIHELSPFAEDAWQLKPSLQLTAGLRLNYFSNLEKVTLAPRLMLTTQIHPRHTIKLSAGRYHQNVITANTEEDVLAPYEVWAPLQKQHQLSSAWNMSAAWIAELSDEYSFRTEIYLKDLSNVGIMNRNRFLDSDPLLYQYDGRAWGFEIFAEKRSGRLTAWLGYHFNRTYLNIDGRNVAPGYYRKHTLNLTGEYNFNKKWSAGFSWVLSSGQPYQLVIGEYEAPLPDGSGGGGLIETPTDFYTYPPYHRLDVSFFRHFY